MRPFSRPLGPAALLLGLLVWISCSELPTAPPTDWRSNFGPGFAVVNGATFAGIVPTDLGFGVFSSKGFDVNDARWVVGRADGDAGRQAFLWRPGPGLGMEDLVAGGTAYAVNNNGQVVGQGGGGVAFLWTDGAAPPLVNLTCATTCIGIAFGLNDGDPVVVVGQVTLPSTSFHRAAWWTATTT